MRKMIPVMFSIIALSLTPFAFADSARDTNLEFAGTLEETLGHFWALELNLDENNSELAIVHATHPIAELYDTMSSHLQDNPEFNEKLQSTLMELKDTASTDVDIDDAKAAIDSAKEVIEEARDIVVASDYSDEPEFQLQLINALLETAKVEYHEAVTDGQITEMAEFQDGSAFVWRSQQIFVGFENIMKWKYLIIGIIAFFLISSLIIIIKYPGLIPSDELKESEQYSLSKFNQTHVKDSDLIIEKLQTDLGNPTKMTFVGSDLLIAHKNSGEISLLKEPYLHKEVILDLNVESFGERGLVGLSSATVDDKNYVLVYFTSPVDENDHYSDWISPNYKNNDGSKLVRYDYVNEKLENPTLLLHPIHHSNPLHQGGSMVIDNDLIFLGIGDNDGEPNPLTNSNTTIDLKGKGAGILSIDLDGNPNPKNPFHNDDLKNYFSYGIRNIYGLGIDPITGNIWDSENGPSEFDEINLVFPGFNSGWSKIMGPSSEGLFSSNINELI